MSISIGKRSLLGFEAIGQTSSMCETADARDLVSARRIDEPGNEAWGIGRRRRDAVIAVLWSE